MDLCCCLTVILHGVFVLLVFYNVEQLVCFYIDFIKYNIKNNEGFVSA